LRIATVLVRDGLAGFAFVTARFAVLAGFLEWDARFVAMPSSSLRRPRGRLRSSDQLPEVLGPMERYSFGSTPE
jgi:hypothetical protein